MQGLDGKLALVTGASGGIGREIACRLAGAGATVCVHFGANREEANTTLSLLKEKGGSGFIVGADLSSNAGIAALFEQIRSQHATIDILVNNAGVGAGGTIDATDETTFDRIFTVDVKAPFFVTQQALQMMPDRGRIINISSMVSLAAYPSTVAYSAAKAALNAMTRSIAAGLGPRGITVNAVAPGATETNFLSGVLSNPEFMQAIKDATAFGRLGTPEDIAGVVAFLASPDAGWITGQVIAASGGMHL